MEADGQISIVKCRLKGGMPRRLPVSKILPKSRPASGDGGNHLSHFPEPDFAPRITGYAAGPVLTTETFTRVARLSRNVRQSNHILVNQIAGHKAERGPGAREEWLATTKHDGVEVESILVNKTEVR